MCLALLIVDPCLSPSLSQVHILSLPSQSLICLIVAKFPAPRITQSQPIQVPASATPSSWPSHPSTPASLSAPSYFFILPILTNYPNQKALITAVGFP